MGPISAAVIERAKSFLGDIEAGNNDGPWLEQLMASDPKRGWKAGESYCIGALSALFDTVCKDQGQTMPIPTSLSSRGFYESAKAEGWTLNGPDPLKTYEPGDIAIFSEGNTWLGHAALITAVTPEGLSTIEFNTSDTNKGDQRNGGGCF